MKYIKLFKESIFTERSGEDLKGDIQDIFIDSFISEGIPVYVTHSPARLCEYTNSIKYRQNVNIEIKHGARVTRSYDVIKVTPQAVSDLERLLEWSKVMNYDFDCIVVYFNKGFEKTIEKKDINMLGEIFTSREFLQNGPNDIIISFIKLGWQTVHKWTYGNEIKNQIIQQYDFPNMDSVTKFISKSMQIFEKYDHHPHFFKWDGTRVLISLKTHSSNDVTQVDWDVAGELDKISEEVNI
jgi:pterin-4a-carbinolamine dehydratase